MTLSSDPLITRVHCVAVRPRKAHHPRRSRLLALQSQSSKVIPYESDLSNTAFGLSEEQFSGLARDVDLVIHAGARRSFWDSYSNLRDGIVESTKQLVRLVAESKRLHGKTVPINFISVGERELANGPGDGNPGYIASKWVSELILENAYTHLDIPVTIHRMLPVTEKSTVSDNFATQDALFEEFAELVQKMGALPSEGLWAGRWDIMPVKQIADTIVHSAMQEPPQSGVNFVPLRTSVSMTMNGVLARLRKSSSTSSTSGLDKPNWRACHTKSSAWMCPCKIGGAMSLGHFNGKKEYQFSLW